MGLQIRFLSKKKDIWVRFIYHLTIQEPISTNDCRNRRPKELGLANRWISHGRNHLKLLAMKETQNSKSEFMSSIHLSIYSTLKLNISSLPCIVILCHTFSIHIIGILHSMHIGTNMITRCKGCSMFCFCVRQIAALVIIVLRRRVL